MDFKDGEERARKEGKKEKPFNFEVSFHFILSRLLVYMYISPVESSLLQKKYNKSKSTKVWQQRRDQLVIRERELVILLIL